jgi:hypothetical protein
MHSPHTLLRHPVKVTSEAPVQSTVWPSTHLCESQQQCSQAQVAVWAVQVGHRRVLHTPQQQEQAAWCLIVLFYPCHSAVLLLCFIASGAAVFTGLEKLDLGLGPQMGAAGPWG